MIKILVVEDMSEWQKIWARALAGKVEILSATSIPDGLTLFRANQDGIALIVMDACVPGDRPNTLGVVELMRQLGFEGPIIGTSSLDNYRAALMRSGCNHEAEKGAVPVKVLEILGL